MNIFIRIMKTMVVDLFKRFILVEISEIEEKN